MDSSKTSYGESEFKSSTREGVGIRGVVEGVQECFALDIKGSKRHSTRVGEHLFGK